MDNMEKKTPLNDLMRATMEKIHEMVDTNTIVDQPITCLLYTSDAADD